MFNKKKSIEIKNEIQDYAVKLLYSYSKILLSWATGCGKTLASLKMIKLYHNAKLGVKGYIICKESTHLDNWEKDIKLHNMEFINGISEKFLYASLHKYEKKGFVDFVILDEVHGVTEKRSKQLKNIIGPDTLVIMLSATVNDKRKILIRNVVGNFHENHISISDAIKKGILPCPKVFVHYYGMNSKQLKLYNDITSDINELKKEYEETREEWDYIKWISTGNKRKKMMAEMKNNMAKDLISKYFKDSRYICFTGSKLQAELLSGKGRNYIHSDKSKKSILNKKNSFNDGRINNLFVVNMFREAINLNDIEKGLIVQLDNVKLTFIQMLGRVFRSSMPEMHIIVFKDTQDDVYLKNVLWDFNKDYVTFINH